MWTWNHGNRVCEQCGAPADSPGAVDREGPRVVDLCRECWEAIPSTTFDRHDWMPSDIAVALECAREAARAGDLCKTAAHAIAARLPMRTACAARNYLERAGWWRDGAWDMDALGL